MKAILVSYYSKSGHTATMAEAIAEGVANGGAEPVLRSIDAVPVESLLDYDGLILGAPVYYGLPPAPIKLFFDESVPLHGRLAGKVGGAFVSSANIGGGNETTAMAILQMMLVHGMVLIGAAQGDHYGPIGINAPEPRVLEQCRVHGERIATLARRLHAVDVLDTAGATS